MMHQIGAIRSSVKAKILLLLVASLSCFMAIGTVSSHYLQRHGLLVEFLLLSALTICFTAMLYRRISRILILRISSLASIAEACAAGGVSRRPTDAPPDELGGLASSLDRLATGCVENIAGSDEIHRRTGLLDELIVRSERMSMFNGLTAGYAHEINNRLGAIMQNAQNIERRISTELPGNLTVAREVGIGLDSLHEYLVKRGVPGFVTNIRDAGARAAAMVTRMMSCVRSREPVRESSALDTILDRALELANYDYELKKLYDFRQIEVEREYDPSLPPVMMTVADMEQVFMSIIRNAAQAMKAPGMTRRSRIALRTRREGDAAVVEIEDNGPGMDEDVRRRIFDPFFTTKGKGSGLGLPAARSIITSGHRGSIDVLSEPDQGCRVAIRLPLDGGGP